MLVKSPLKVTKPADSAVVDKGISLGVNYSIAIEQGIAKAGAVRYSNGKARVRRNGVGG